MIVVLESGTLSLTEYNDFKRFSFLYLDTNQPQPGPGPFGIEFTSDGHVWIPISTIVALRYVEATEHWHRQFHAMIDKARPYGWIDEAGGRIRAHIELARNSHASS